MGNVGSMGVALMLNIYECTVFDCTYSNQLMHIVGLAPGECTICVYTIPLSCLCDEFSPVILELYVFMIS